MLKRLAFILIGLFIHIKIRCGSVVYWFTSPFEFPNVTRSSPPIKASPYSFSLHSSDTNGNHPSSPMYESRARITQNASWMIDKPSMRAAAPKRNIWHRANSDPRKHLFNHSFVERAVRKKPSLHKPSDRWSSRLLKGPFIKSAVARYRCLNRSR